MRLRLDKSKRDRWKFLSICCVAEIIIILGILLFIRIQNHHQIEIDIDLRELQSNYITYTGDGWYADENIVSTDNRIVLTFGPYIPLKKGSYTVEILYECDENQSLRPYTNSGGNIYLKTGNVQLSRNKNFVQYDFTLTKDIPDFEIQTYYSGKGAFSINGLKLHSNNNRVLRTMTYLYLFFILADLWILFYDWIKKNKTTLFSLIGLSLFCSIPLFADGAFVGHDFGYHILRIESVANELQRGVFPVRLSSLFFDGNGYPSSIFYNDIMLYFPALLRNLGFSIVQSYNAYILFVNVSTAIISYLCFKAIFRSQKATLFCCFAYMTASYRLVDIYIRSAVGEYTALIFLPVIALGVYQIYHQDDAGTNCNKRAAILLAVGMSGLLGSHLLSTEMVVFVLLINCVLLYKRSLKKQTIKTYIAALLETLMLNLYFIIPFMDYYVNVPVKITDAVNGDSAKLIQDNGAYIAEYFTFFMNSDTSRSLHHTSMMPLTPGIVLMIMLVISVFLWVHNKATSEIKYFTIFSLLALYMASNVFPWNVFAERSKLMNLFAQIQFPWRYIGIAILLMSLLTGVVIEHLNEIKIPFSEYSNILFPIFGGVLVLSGIMSNAYFFSDCLIHNSATYYDTSELSTYSVGAGEYVRTGTVVGDLSNEIYSDTVTVELIERNGCYMALHCQSGPEGGSVEIPMLNYKGYQVTDDLNHQYEIVDGRNNLIQFQIQPNFDGMIYIDFVEPWYWRAAELTSLLTVVVLIYFTLPKRNARKRNGANVEIPV